MKKVKCFLVILSVFSCLLLRAQSQNKSATGSHLGKDAATKNQNAADTTARNSRGENSEAANPKKSGNASNTSGMMEHTSSASGSPAMLSEGKGSERDGTNNVQRATMNMAGSPAQNLKLAKNPADASIEAEKGRGKVSERGINRKPNVINNKSRRENNDLSDQNLSSKNKASKTIQDNTRKKSKRRKSKG